MFIRILRYVLVSVLICPPVCGAFDIQQYREDNARRVLNGESVLSFDLSGGMFGDNLIAYLHAKWIAYKQNVPLLYPDFEYASELVLSDVELLGVTGNLRFLRHIDKTGGCLTLRIAIDEGRVDPALGALYLVPWFPESLQEFEYVDSGWRPYFFVNWEDYGFLEQARAMISPRKQLKLLDVPKDKLTVAVHVRRNRNGQDLSLSFEQGDYIDAGRQYLDDYFPFKCLDDNFYIMGIQKIHELYPDKQLYVYIFTDDKSPDKIAKKYQEALNIPSIIFDHVGSSHDYSSHVLEDFFSMLKFDCLVRSDSSFSLVASKLGHYQVVVSPAGYVLKNNHPVIVRAHVSVNLLPQSSEA